MTSHTPPIRIRAAVIADTSRIAWLLEQLGYATPPTEVADRVQRLAADAKHLLRVAVIDEPDAAGVIHAAEIDVLESGRRCEILGLVADQPARGRGVGRALVTAAERWAAERGLARVSVRSNVVRPESHAFFARLGYVRAKTQHVYRKTLA